MEISQVDEEMETTVNLLMPEVIGVDAENDPMRDASDDWDQDLMQEGLIEDIDADEGVLQDDDMLDEGNTEERIVAVTEDADVDLSQGDDAGQEDEDILYEEDEPINLDDEIETQEQQPSDATDAVAKHLVQHSGSEASDEAAHTQEPVDLGMDNHILVDKDLKRTTTFNLPEEDLEDDPNAVDEDLLTEPAEQPFDQVPPVAEEDSGRTFTQNRDFEQSDLPSTINIHQNSRDLYEGKLIDENNTGHTQGFDEPSTGEEGNNGVVPSSSLPAEKLVDNELSSFRDALAAPVDNEVENFAVRDDHETDLGNNDQQDPESFRPLHPVKIHYQDTDISLFPSHEDGVETYFLQDEEVAYQSLNKMLASCRDVLAGSIGDHDEVVLDIPVLGLHISEGSVYAEQLSLSQILDVYSLLNRNSGINDTGPLRCILYTRVCLASQYAYILSSAQGGKKIDQISASSSFLISNGDATVAETFPSAEEHHFDRDENQNSEELIASEPQPDTRGIVNEEIGEIEGTEKIEDFGHQGVGELVEEKQSSPNPPGKLGENIYTNAEHNSVVHQLAKSTNGRLAPAETQDLEEGDAEAAESLTEEEIGLPSQINNLRQSAPSSHGPQHPPPAAEESSRIQDSNSSHTLESDSPQNWTAEEDEDLFDDGDGDRSSSQVKLLGDHAESSKISDIAPANDPGKVQPATDGRSDRIISMDNSPKAEAQLPHLNDEYFVGRHDNRQPGNDPNIAANEPLSKSANETINNAEGIIDYDFEEIATAADGNRDDNEGSDFTEEPKVTSGSNPVSEKVAVDKNNAKRGEIIDIQDFDFVEADSEDLEQKTNNDKVDQYSEGHDGTADRFEATTTRDSTPRSLSKRKIPSDDDEFPLIEVDSPKVKKSRSS